MRSATSQAVDRGDDRRSDCGDGLQRSRAQTEPIAASWPRERDRPKRMGALRPPQIGALAWPRVRVVARCRVRADPAHRPPASKRSRESEGRCKPAACKDVAGAAASGWIPRLVDDRATPRQHNERQPCNEVTQARGRGALASAFVRRRFGPKRSRCARATWSRFNAQVTGIPSSSVRRTSVSRPRTVRVIGTTMISLRRGRTSSRVRTSTGRRLSGRRKVYQRISPRITRRSPSRRHPTRADPRPR